MKIKSLKKSICIGLAAMGIVSMHCINTFAFEHPAWGAVDENGNPIVYVEQDDGTYQALPTWYEAYAALDYDSAPDDIKEIILMARRCLALEKLGYSSYDLHMQKPDLHNPDLGE